MNVVFKPMFKPITDESVHQLEQTLKVVLPEDYRTFLLQYNGGAPSHNLFFISKEQQESSVSLFYGIAPKSGYDIWANALDFYQCHQRNLLPIGEDPGGNQIIMRLGPTSLGTICFHDHEQEGASSYFPIANSFSDLLGKLYKSSN